MGLPAGCLRFWKLRSRPCKEEGGGGGDIIGLLVHASKVRGTTLKSLMMTKDSTHRSEESVYAGNAATGFFRRISCLRGWRLEWHMYCTIHATM